MRNAKETGTPSANRQIARAAGTVMAAFVLSNLVGLLRQVVISQAFGTSAALDAFNAAARLPDLLFNLVAGGALGSAFIPTFTGFLAHGERERAWRLASAIANWVTLILTTTAALAFLFAPLIVRYLLAPGFSPAQQALTTALLRILLLSPIIFGLSGLLMGILNAHQHFLLPALAPTMYWLGMIFGVLVWSPRWGIFGLAWGAVLGAALHLGVQVPGLLRLPARRYWPTLSLHDPAVRQVARLMAPRVLGVAIVQLNFWLNTVLASLQPEGSLTAIQIAWAVMTMPQVVIAQAIAIAALPTFSAQVARGELHAMRHSLAATLRGVIFLSLPAAAGLILLRRPVVAALFQRGAFDARSTELVAWALLWYTVGLVPHSVVEILARAFYAFHDTKTPVLVGGVAMTLNLVFSVAFVVGFRALGWMPHGGLALANSLATTLEMFGLLALMRRRLEGLESREMLTGAAQALGATLVMTLALLYLLRQGAAWSPWRQVVVLIPMGALTYLLALWGSGAQEPRLLWNGLRRRLGGLGRAH